MLKLNDDKTEVILFTSKHALKSHPSVAVTVGEQHVRPATSIRNLGVIYDQPFRAVANGPVGPAMAGPIIEPVILYFYFIYFPTGPIIEPVILIFAICVNTDKP